MPFAVIAIVLLIIGSAYGVMITQSNETEEVAENIITELSSLDQAIENTRSSIERGLGEVIFEISNDPEGGSLENRAEIFKDRSKKWMNSSFPSMDRGVSVSIKDFNFDLVAESLKMSSGDAFTEGFSPSYLKAEGHYSAKFSSGSGTAERVVSVSSDGTCALPLVAEQGSLFDNMVSGNGSALSQIMTYQLTSLAQYRVLNGYGALGQYGDMGTMSIITSSDVKASYESSLRLIETLVFRSDSELSGLKKVDMADIFVADDGYVEIDLSAIYSQAMISVMDDLILKWFDYLYGNILLDKADDYLDKVRNAWDSLKGFFTKNNEFSAAPYIERVLTENGLDLEHHRYLLSGKSASINIPDTVINIDGGSITIPGSKSSVQYPSVDLMGWSGISKFKSDYRDGNNEIREWIRNVLNAAAVGIGSNKALGTVRIPIDAGDDKDLMSEICNAVELALSKGDSEIERIMGSSIQDQNISDPFYASIFRVISSGQDEIYGISTFKENIRTTVEFGIKRSAADNSITLSDADIQRAVDVAMNSNNIKNIIRGYEDAVQGCLSELAALEKVPGGQPGIIKEISIALVTKNLMFTDIYTNIPKRIITLCNEVRENMDINGYSGLVDLPGTDKFTLTDGDGRISIERLKMGSISSPRIELKGPSENSKDCIHYVGFNENTGASFATTFSVLLNGSLDYTVTSSGTIESSMGKTDSQYKGGLDVDLELKIVVASGWGLAGVNYNPSNNLLEDAWNALIDLLSPILEPLRKVLSMIMDALSILNSALMEFSKYVAAVVEKLYNALIVPLEKIGNFINEKLNDLFNFVLEKAVDAVQWIVDVTMSKQTVGFSFMGFTVTFTTKLATLVNNTKTLLTVTMSCVVDKLTVSGSITIKQKGSGSTKEMLLTGNASIKGDGWEVSADIDPMMKSTKHLIAMNGYVKGVKFDILLPDLIQYKQVEFSLSDIPAIGMMLSNIPLPIPGMKASVDAGINLKYNIPFETGILINEFELNPPGEDRDKEWVEIYNATKTRVDLTGYTIHAGSSPKTKVHVIEDLTLSPGQREVIYLPGAFLNNSGSSLISAGECVILKAPDGTEVDKTPAKKDSRNDSFTWQRVADGAIDWTFAEGTPGTGNCGGLVSGEMVKTQIIKILKDSAVKTMGEMKALKSTGDLSEFFKAAMHHAITSGIEMLAGCLVEASIFVSLDITDATSTVCTGIRVALFIDSGFIEEGLKYLVGEIEALLLNIENPYGLKPKEVLVNNLYLGVTVYTGITSPRFMKNNDAYPNVKIGVHVNSNMAGLGRIIGSELGEWKVTVGIIILDCPSIIVPAPLKADPTRDSDLWLLRATFTSV